MIKFIFNFYYLAANLDIPVWPMTEVCKGYRQNTIPIPPTKNWGEI